jgi:putative endonuclease
MPNKIEAAGFYNILTGKKGEEIAKSFLLKRKLRILEQNVRTPFGEIDIICLDKKIIVFVEVKTRISKDFGPPSLSITDKKKNSIIKNALYYLKRNKLLDREARIDVVLINLSLDGSFEKLEHIESAIWVE